MIPALKVAFHRLAGLVAGRRHQDDAAAELEAHVELHTEANIRSGMEPAEARRRAVLALGSMAAVREAVHDQRTVPVLENVARDARVGVRQYLRHPSVSVTATVVLALGLACSVALFAFVDAALLRPLPFGDPGSLVGLYESHPSCRLCNLSYLDYRDWSEQNRVFASADVYRRSGVVLATPSGPEALRAARVSAGFFRTLGVRPAAGRDFAPGEDLPGAPAAVLLSHGAWQRRFGGRDMVGSTIEIDGTPHAVVGVLPRGFAFAPAEPAEVWIPLQPTDTCSQRRSCHNLYGIARLKPGVTVAAALGEMQAIASRLEQAYPDSNRGQAAAVVPLADAVVGQVRPVLLLLQGGALLLLAIAAVNVTGLLVVRSQARRRELAVRHAIGASAGRLFAQLATESLLLVGAGSVLGLVLASGALRLLVRAIPAAMLPGLPFFHDLGLGARPLAFALCVAALAVVLFTVVPWLIAGRGAGLAAAGDRRTTGTTWQRLGSRLVMVELALAMVLLLGAGLLGRSLVQLMQVDLGLQPDRLVLVEVGASPTDASDAQRLRVLAEDVRRAVAALPLARAAALTTDAPVGTRANTRWFRVVGRSDDGSERKEAPIRSITAGYFRTLGASLARGRDFDERDVAGRPLVAIVNETFARQQFPGQDAVGQRIAYVSGLAEEMEIVGVVQDVREGTLDAAPRGAIYQPLLQDPSPTFTVAVSTAVAEAVALPEVAAAIRRAAPGAVLRQQTTMTERIQASPTATFQRSSAWLVAAFAAVALLLSAVGLHGLVAYSVGLRQRELAVRVALGAQRGAVRGLVLRDAARLVAMGLAGGLLASAGAARAIQGLLFGVHPWDPLVMGVVALVLAGTALLAAAAPAQRAARVDPVEALRAE